MEAITAVIIAVTTTAVAKITQHGAWIITPLFLLKMLYF